VALAEAEKKLANSAADPAADWDAVLKSVASAKTRLEVAAHGGDAGSGGGSRGAH
jgi:hypothetical protein